MAPRQGRAVGTVVVYGGPLSSSTTPFFLYTGTLSKTLIVVITISGFIGFTVVLFLILKWLHRLRSAPLPPIQPLAHHVEGKAKYLPQPRFPRKNMGFD
ncbi:hypothetical protein BDM02DRAFT_3115318 [Thelephora ganbajun]|uniref:Uncharacterized protein n=1 Tax=Thelephora ganbajun TaxID=370292 RepID=A0ACB6ZGI0_THEGA|nr:hypothetical protein BDM02DRAFT_3115318 [Thelephora ganbajun]